MPPDKSKSPPDSSHLSNGLDSSAPGERPEPTTARNPEQTVATALRYAAFGLPVFPVRSSGARAKQARKSARRSNGQPWGATTNPDRIRAYWREHPDDDVGIATGGGLLVIDVDTMEGHGRDGLASLAALEARHGKLPRTWKARTPSGGLHFYFLVPDGVRVPCSTSKLGPGIDVRGEGGYVVAPSTLQLCCGERAWLDADTMAWTPSPLLRVLDRRSPVVTIDPALANLLQQDGRNGVSADPDDLPSPQTFAEDDVRLKLTCALAVIPADCSYDEWFRIGCGIRAALGDAGFDLFDEWSASAPHRYDPEGTRRKWAECGKVRRVTEDTVYWLADQRDRRWRDVYAEMRAERDV